MKRLRRALGPIAAAWLCCQVATLALAPAALVTDSAHAGMACTCADGVGGACPMHHHTPVDPKRCVLQSAHEDGAAALTSLMGPMGPLPSSTEPIALASTGTTVVTVLSRPTRRPLPPEPPPPRA